MDKNFLKTILNRLNKMGCHEADVFLSKSKTSSCSSRLGKIEKKKNHPQMKLGLERLLIRNSPLYQQPI